MHDCNQIIHRKINKKCHQRRPGSKNILLRVIGTGNVGLRMAAVLIEINLIPTSVEQQYDKNCIYVPGGCIWFIYLYTLGMFRGHWDNRDIAVQRASTCSQPVHHLMLRQAPVIIGPHIHLGKIKKNRQKYKY